MSTSNVIYMHIDEDGYCCFQRAEYIEDGWYIREVDNQFQVWEIAQYGGDEYHHSTFDSFKEAYDCAISFT